MVDYFLAQTPLPPQDMTALWVTLGSVLIGMVGGVGMLIKQLQKTHFEHYDELKQEVKVLENENDALKDKLADANNKAANAVMHVQRMQREVQAKDREIEDLKIKLMQK